jgi:hypothetical protein
MRSTVALRHVLDHLVEHGSRRVVIQVDMHGQNVLVWLSQHLWSL